MSDNFWGVWLPVLSLLALLLIVAGLIWWSEARRFKRNPPPWLLPKHPVDK